jgi:hypothetical protein
MNGKYALQMNINGLIGHAHRAVAELRQALVFRS